MTEDSIQRPRGRHSQEELGGTPEPPRKEKRKLFSRKEEEDEPEIFTARSDLDEGDQGGRFSRRRKAESEPEPFVPPEPAPEPAREPEPERREKGPTVASISLAGATPQPVQGPEAQTPEPERSDFPDAPPEPAKRRFGRKEEDRKGTWGDRGYSATDEEAHRDRTYRIPSFARQTVTVFMVQMRLYSKAKWTYFMLFMALLIPIITLALSQVFDAIVAETPSSTAFIGVLLAMMPILLGFFTAILSGPAIGREFKDRTAYMNVSLPLSRSSFYLGKYLAGFVLSLGVFMFAYGMAVATSTVYYDTIFADLITESLAMMVVALFSYSATAFCIGAFTRKPSSMTPFMLMTFILPALLMIVRLRYGIEGLMLLPCFLPDVSLAFLGTPVIGSVSGFFGLMMGGTLVDVDDAGVMTAIGLVWGIAFLALGLYRTKRREM